MIDIHHPYGYLGFQRYLGQLFKKGGYDPIRPYAKDDESINVWYTNTAGQRIYLQGLFVERVEGIPGGYTLVRFPASDFWSLPPNG